MEQRQRKKGAVDRINSAVDTYQKAQTAIKIGRAVGTATEAVATSEAWAPVAIIVGVILLIIIFVVIIIIATTGGGTGLANPAPGGGTPISSGGCPDTSTNTDPATCHYLNPAIDIFNTNISQSAIDNYINAYSPTFINAGIGDLNEFRRRVNEIRDKAVFVGLNPAIFLGYWKTESLFSTYRGARDLGCAGPTFEAQVDCAVGLSPGGAVAAKCAVSRDPNSSSCQSLRNAAVTLPIATFDDFAEAYGARSADPQNCAHTYNGLIEAAKELGACIPSQALDCPIPPNGSNGVVTCGSERIPIAGCGHCTQEYIRNFPQAGRLCSNPNYPEIHYAMDISGGDLDSVYLPKINGHVVMWTFANQSSSAVYSGQATQDYSGVDQETGERYYIRFHHTQINSGNTTGTHPSGDVGAQICGVYPPGSTQSCNMGHVHVELLRVLPTGQQPLEAPNYFSCVR